MTSLLKKPFPIFILSNGPLSIDKKSDFKGEHSFGTLSIEGSNANHLVLPSKRIHNYIPQQHDPKSLLRRALMSLNPNIDFVKI